MVNNAFNLADGGTSSTSSKSDVKKAATSTDEKSGAWGWLNKALESVDNALGSVSSSMEKVKGISSDINDVRNTFNTSTDDVVKSFASGVVDSAMPSLMLLGGAIGLASFIFR